MIEILKMKEEDVDEVARIEKENFSVPWSKQAFLESLSLEHTIYLVARKDGKLAGYCGMYKVFNEGEIVNVAVDEPFRKCGVAVEMLGRLLQLGEEAGIDTFLLEVRESNFQARKLYEKLGFAQAGIRKNFYERPVENGIVMWKQKM